MILTGIYLILRIVGNQTNIHFNDHNIQTPAKGNRNSKTIDNIEQKQITPCHKQHKLTDVLSPARSVQE